MIPEPTKLRRKQTQRRRCTNADKVASLPMPFSLLSITTAAAAAAAVAAAAVAAAAAATTTTTTTIKRCLTLTK